MELSPIKLRQYQASLRELLTKYEPIAGKLKTCLKIGFSDNEASQIVQESLDSIVRKVNQAITNINNFELRIVVIASMKSGKSTIINALIGENILPARGNPMTILPTEVAFKSEIKAPKLILTNETIVLIGKIQRQVEKWLDDKGDSINSILDNQSHLIEIVKKIRNEKDSNKKDGNEKDSKSPVLSTDTFNLDDIQKILIFINDLVRIFLVLSKKLDSTSGNISLQPFLDKNIRLEVPVANLTLTGMADIEASIGNLVIVDTPGPNEASASVELQKVVTQELQKAGLIVVVLNYTVMGTVADADILKEINVIRDINSTRDTIYAIVNKVDQRRKGDMSEIEVKNMVRTKYKITEKSENPTDRRIFEMKAIQCLAFRRFMKEKGDFERDKIPCIPRDMKTIEELFTELHPFGNFKPDDATLVERISQDGAEMWMKAGLQEFIKGPISDLFKNLAPLSIQKAANVCLCSGKELEKRITDRQSLFKADKHTLEKEKSDLEKSCQELKMIQEKNQTTVTSIMTRLKLDLANVIQKISMDCRQMSNVLFENQAWDLRSQLVKHHTRGTFMAGLVGGGFVALSVLSGGAFVVSAGLTSLALATISGWSAVKHLDDGKMFDSHEEVELFLDSFSNDINRICEERYDSARTEINDRCISANESLEAHIIDSISGIVASVDKNFKSKFNIELDTMKTFDIEIVQMTAVVEKAVHRFRPSWGYTLFGWKTRVSAAEAKNVKKSELKLQVSKKEIADACEQAIKTNMDRLRVETEKHFETQIKTTCESNYNKLDLRFRQYIESMTETLNRKNISIKHQEKFTSESSAILREIQIELAKAITIATELQII